MLSARWLEKRKPYWTRLEEMVERAGGRGVGVLSYRELQELGQLYRQVAADLASVREDPMSRRLADYLNQLLGRAHNLIYMGRKARPRGILEFYRTTFPQVFRATFNYTLLSFALFAAGALAGFLWCLADPEFQRFFLGPHMTATIERRQMWTHSIVTMKPLASSFIMTNNLAVSFMVFAMGIAAGLGTAFMLVQNGLLMGVISAACWQAGMTLQLAEFVAPHGVLELPAIFVAGGAGLLIGRGLLFPGPMLRRDALVFYGGQAVRLLLGIIPWLVIAGIVEGYISPTTIPWGTKFLLAASLAIVAVLYVTQAGRTPRCGNSGSRSREV
jgi:uncharacterized membrane protein SpoIIM required for sporulation